MLNAIFDRDDLNSFKHEDEEVFILLEFALLFLKLLLINLSLKLRTGCPKNIILRLYSLNISPRYRS